MEKQELIMKTLDQQVANNHERAYCKMTRTMNAKDKRDAEINSLAKSLRKDMSDDDYFKMENIILEIFGEKYIDSDGVEEALETLFNIKATSLINNQKACY